MFKTTPASLFTDYHPIAGSAYRTNEKDPDPTTFKVLLLPEKLLQAKGGFTRPQ